MSLSRSQRSYLDLARRVSKNSDCRCKIGSVVVKSGRVLSVGYNEKKIGPRVIASGYKHTLHAELSACLGLSECDLRGATLYNWRETKHGRMTQSKPCEVCQNVLRRFGVRKVYYTTDASLEVMVL